ncbi:polyphosphate polymerase domain-containing protein [Candidatus Peregrinibacteria bacterium]|nr:polyphosphate polymerase domain-containing protein [Candidatus Peregrinibacteria bacterium]
MNKNPKLHFQRFEMKYQLPLALADRLVPALLLHMKFDQNAQLQNNEMYYEVRSIYFDSIDFRAYHEKIDGFEKRKKLRIRIYGNDDERLFFEIKRKHGQVVKKDRLIVDSGDFTEIISGNFEKFHFANDELEVIEEFVFEKKYFNMRPNTLVAYKRRALVGTNEDKLRITFDYDIQATSLGYVDFAKKTRPILKDMLIMEVKFNNVLPNWVHDIIQKYGLKADSYSKYCAGVEASYPQFV